MDGASLAVLANRFDGVVRVMTNTLLRTSRSGVVNTARDFSCCVVDASDRLVGIAESLPIHVLGGPELMTRSMKDLHTTLRRGDAFLHNSPYHGNTHPADFTILVPVFDEESHHRFTVLAKSHQADCGNAQPTTYVADARDVYEEGGLIFPCVTVQRDYEHVDDVVRLCQQRIRVPSQWWGDHLALVGAARIGERRLLDLAGDVGWDQLDIFSDVWQAYGESRIRSAISALADGHLTVETAHDPFPNVPDGIPIKVAVTVQPKKERILVDLTDNLDCQPCGLNLSEATARAAVLIGVFNSIDPTVPANSGSISRVDIRLRPNCVVGIPRHPASCSVATTNVMDRVANAVQRAIAEISAGSGLAECGLGMPPSVGVISGNDPRLDGSPFINQLVFAWTGGPGGPSEDGWLNAGGVGDGGIVYRDSVEIDELLHPIRIVRQEIIRDSEGAGEFRGAPGAIAEYGPVDTELEVMYVSDGAINPAQGACGGTSGSQAGQFIRRRGGALENVQPCDHFLLQPGETVISMSTGGGGYGSPVHRDPERVARDVREGWVTAERAGDVYGVILDPDGVVDLVATRGARSSSRRRIPAGDHDPLGHASSDAALR